MEFLVLGPLQVYDAGRSVTIGAPRQRALLAVLLANSNRVVSTDRLLDLVWGDDSPEVGALRYQRHPSVAFDAVFSPTEAECDIYDIDPCPALE